MQKLRYDINKKRHHWNTKLRNEFIEMKDEYKDKFNLKVFNEKKGTNVFTFSHFTKVNLNEE